VVRTCEARRLAPTGVREDYERVNDLLAGVDAGIRRSFLDEPGKAADHHLGQVAHLVSSWSIDKARDVAWVNVLALWELRGWVLGEGYGSVLARAVGTGSRLLLTSLA